MRACAARVKMLVMCATKKQILGDAVLKKDN